MLNLFVPLYWGFTFAHEAGRIGICWASLVLLGSGWWFCYQKPAAGRWLILGSAFMATSQFVPILQINAGMFSMFRVSKLGLQSELSRNFFVTLLGGTMLIAVAATIGWCLRCVSRLLEKYFSSSL